jgi:hypothetical protein
MAASSRQALEESAGHAAANQAAADATTGPERAGIQPWPAPERWAQPVMRRSSSAVAA